MKKIFQSCLLSFLITVSIIDFSYADTSTDPTPQLQAAADQYLNDYHMQEGFSAITLSVSTPTIPLITVNSGCTQISDPEHCIVPTENNLYQIGSNTKAFMAVILLQLEAEHVHGFNINNPLSKYFALPLAWQQNSTHEITVKELLNMTSGIPDYTSDNQFWNDIINNPYRKFTPTDLIAYTVNQPLDFIPGTSWEYSNTNYIFAGLLIEKLTGHSLQYEIQTRISTPLNLNDIYYKPFAYPNIPFYTRMVHGYDYMSGQFPVGTDITDYSISALNSAGALIATIPDVLQWAHALYTSPTLLAPQQRAELESLVDVNNGQAINKPDPWGYGLGVWSMIGPHDETVYLYMGTPFGYNVMYVYFPKEQITIVFGINSSTSGDPSVVTQLLAFVDRIYDILEPGDPANLVVSQMLPVTN